MTNQSETLTGQSQTAASGMDRLDQEFSDTPVTQNTTETTDKPEEKPVATLSETEVVEGVKQEEKFEEPIKEEPVKEVKETPVTETITDEGFNEDQSTESQEGSWKSLLDSLEWEAPTDFSEEKGFETLKALIEQKTNEKAEQAKSFTLTDIYSELPENTRAEAQFVFEQMKTGLSVEEINAPFLQIKEWKGMPKEQLIRMNLEKTEGITQEVVDHEMEKLTADPKKLDLEYSSLMLGINRYEKGLVEQRQAEIKHFNDSQNQIREQKKIQEINSIKAALDKMPSFMEKKLSEENKKSVLSAIQGGELERLSAADKAEFMLWKRYGKQGLQYLTSRATEKVVLEKAKTQHNVPTTTSGGNRVETTQHKTGMDRLDATT